ncbi:MAG TPA: hypothetical protein PKC91_07610 [Ignavibacteria bacterium]|nr:hypothetical protein [Ignavibacteria bacterium]
MEENTENKEMSHFPEDRDAPHSLEKRSFFKNLYWEHKKAFDLMIFLVISLMTLTTISLSIYIVFSKYL